MKKLRLQMKKRIAIGVIALLISAVCVSILLMQYQKDWIMLVGVIMFSILYAKCIREDEFISMVKERFSRRSLFIAGFVLVFIGLSFLPDSVGAFCDGSIQFFVYFISFICWMLGMMVWDIRSN